MTCFKKTTANEYSCDDQEILEKMNTVLTSVWSDNIGFTIQSRISRSLLLDLQNYTRRIYPPIIHTNESNHRLMITYQKTFIAGMVISKSAKLHDKQELSLRFRKFHINEKILRGPQMCSKTEAILESRFSKCSITISDVDEETILRIPYHDNGEKLELMYFTSYDAFPGYPYNVVEVDGDHNLFHTAFCTDKTYSKFAINAYIQKHPRQCGELLASEQYACQLKRGITMLGQDMHHSTNQTNWDTFRKPDPLHLFSYIDQAIQSENTSHLAKVLAKYESETRSAEGNSLEHETKMASPVSRDARNLFLSSGTIFEEVTVFYRDFVVEKINDGDITAALKLCCIGHQVSFCRDIRHSYQLLSDPQILGDTIDRMLKIERSKFLSICDEWYRVLEPQNLMNIEQNELLRKWITDRQYANTEDPIVSLVILKCLIPRKEECRKEQEAILFHQHSIKQVNNDGN